MPSRNDIEAIVSGIADEITTVMNALYVILGRIDKKDKLSRDSAFAAIKAVQSTANRLRDFDKFYKGIVIKKMSARY